MQISTKQSLTKKTLSLAVAANILLSVILSGFTGTTLASASSPDAYQPTSTFLSPIKGTK